MQSLQKLFPRPFFYLVLMYFISQTLNYVFINKVSSSTAAMRLKGIEDENRKYLRCIILPPDYPTLLYCPVKHNNVSFWYSNFTDQSENASQPKANSIVFRE